MADDPLLLYVESARGYANLCRLLSPAGRTHRQECRRSFCLPINSAGPYRLGELAGFTEGLIAVCSDERLAEMFKGSFYRLVTAAKAKSPAVACPRFTMLCPATDKKYDIVQSIRTLTLLQEDHQGKRKNGRLHFSVTSGDDPRVQGSS